MRYTNRFLATDRNKRSGVSGCGAAAVCLVVLLAAAPMSEAQPQADPDVLVFNRLDQRLTTRITHDGEPLPAEQMGQIRLWATGTDYSHMFHFERADGALTLVPSDTCEIGSYDLEMTTPAGNVHVKVYTPLDEMPRTLEMLAAAEGITVSELRERMGLVTRVGTVEVSFSLPEVYYEGQAIELELEPLENVVHTWKVNDDVVKQGPDAYSLHYVLEQPGFVVVEYTATRGDRVVAEARDSTVVAQLPAISWSVPKDVEFTLHATPGYDRYAWSVDGVPAGTGRAFTHTFTQAGNFTIECLAKEAAAGPRDTFLRIRYNVTVTE